MSKFPTANGKGLIYDNIEGSNETMVIDTSKMDVIKRFSLSPYERPTSLSMGLVNNCLFSVYRKSNMGGIFLQIIGTKFKLYFERIIHDYKSTIHQKRRKISVDYTSSAETFFMIY